MKALKGKTLVIAGGLLFCLLSISCNKEEIIIPTPQTLEVNDFIWKSLNDVYLWDDYIPENIDRTKEIDPEAYFEKLLFKPTDRWSFITDDYEALINSFKGIEKSFGLYYKLYQLPDGNNIIGVVKYVVPGSPADLEGIVRGDIVYKVNGTTLTINNYYELLYENDSYTLSFGEFTVNGNLVVKDEKSLNSVILTENPIHLYETFEFDGNKIGYLSYNQFIMDFEDSLVHVFQSLKNEGVSDLVLDLRYNPGGSVHTAILLSSMIAPAHVVNNTEVFSRVLWNEQVTDYFLELEGEESNNLVYRFVNPEVNLDLERVYILITRNSASASELLINCLEPYMDVILIGPENTTGKYVGSITIDDDDADHGWALQPIVMKSANVNSVSDYSNGFSPDYVIDDDFNAPLGTVSEDMLAQALELITGKTFLDQARIAEYRQLVGLRAIEDRNLISKQNMYIDQIR